MSLVIGKKVVIGKGVSPAASINIGKFAPVTYRDPLLIVTSVPSVWYLNGDVGITIGTGVSSWADQSGNGRNFAQSTGANQPSYSGSAISGRGAVTFDGVNGVLFTPYVMPAPGTTPSWYWIVFNSVTSGTGPSIFSGSGSSRHRFYWSSAPNMAVNNGTASTVARPTNTWYRAEILFTNSTSDYKKIGASSSTGINFGNSTGLVNMCLGALSNGPTSPANVIVAAFGCWAGEPTASEKIALDAWTSKYYGGLITL